MQLVTKNEMTQIQGGWGYRWTCLDCGYRSEWHMRWNTADTNARRHAAARGHRTYWYYN